MGRTRQNTSKSDQKISKKDVKKNSQCDEKKRNYQKAQNKRKKEKRRLIWLFELMSVLSLSIIQMVVVPIGKECKEY